MNITMINVANKRTVRDMKAQGLHRELMLAFEKNAKDSENWAKYHREKHQGLGPGHHNHEFHRRYVEIHTAKAQEYREEAQRLRDEFGPSQSPASVA